MEAANEFAIIDTSDTFGGGNLQHYYGLRSNTSAHGFLKVMQQAKTKKAKGDVGQLNMGSAQVIKKKEYSNGSISGVSPNLMASQRNHSVKIQVV